MERDPREDPQPGDCVQKGNKTRLVRRREGYYIYYVLVLEPKDGEDRFSAEKNCWITTWQDWCKGAVMLPRKYAQRKYVSTQQDRGFPGYPERSGETVVLLHRLSRKDADPEVGPMWRVKFGDGLEIDAFEDELKEDGDGAA